MKDGIKPPLAIVVAVGRNGAIGRDGVLPWTMPGDLAHFRDLTMGAPMIMGRRTFESIGGPLPGRDSVVVTRGPALAGVFRAGDPDEAMAVARQRAEAVGATKISLIGGATLFSTMMPLVARVHMTIVDLAPSADTFFPDLDLSIWMEIRRTRPERHKDDEASCVFVDYVRRGSGHLD